MNTPSKHMRVKPAAVVSSAEMESTMDRLASLHVCPLTKRLPVNPVLAEDALIYEKEAIEKNLALQSLEGKENITSPATLKPMGDKLVPASEAVLETIKTLATSSAVDANIAVAWKNREHFNATKAKAEKGDVMAMFHLGKMLLYPMKPGIDEDDKEALSWFKRAAGQHMDNSLANIWSMTEAGRMLLIDGGSFRKNIREGELLLLLAAEKGSDYACYLLGLLYKGHYKAALPKWPIDKAQAKFWIKKSLDGSCWVKCMGSMYEKSARYFLSQLEKE